MGGIWVDWSEIFDEEVNLGSFFFFFLQKICQVDCHIAL